MPVKAAIRAVDLGLIRPFPPRQQMRPVAKGQRFRLARRIRHHLGGKIGHRRDVIGNLARIGPFARRSQDQAEIPRVHDVMGNLQKRLARVLVLDPARDVDPRRIGRDDGIAAFEQNLVGDRDRLARLGIARDLHKQGLTGGQAVDLPHKGRPVGRAQEHPALPLHRAFDDGAIDRARCGLVRVEEQILDLPIHHQCRRLAVAHMVKRDQSTFHSDTP